MRERRFSTRCLYQKTRAPSPPPRPVRPSLRFFGPVSVLSLIHILIDGSPGVGCPVMASMNGVSLALIVTEPSLSGPVSYTHLDVYKRQSTPF